MVTFYSFLNGGVLKVLEDLNNKFIEIRNNDEKIIIKINDAPKLINTRSGLYNEKSAFLIAFSANFPILFFIYVYQNLPDTKQVETFLKLHPFVLQNLKSLIK